MISRDIIIKIWREVIDWYIENSRYWNGLLSLAQSIDEFIGNPSLLDESYGLWGRIWHEHDLVLVFSHRLLGFIDNEGLDLHLHINYKLKPRNFRFFRNFYENIDDALKSLRKRLKMRSTWYPEVDLIVSRDAPPFHWCFEFKYYHYVPHTLIFIEDLERKLLTLEVLKSREICMDAGLLLLDDGICRSSEIPCQKINEILKNAANKLLVLDYYVSVRDLVKVIKNLIK